MSSIYSAELPIKVNQSLTWRYNSLSSFISFAALDHLFLFNFQFKNRFQSLEGLSYDFSLIHYEWKVIFLHL
jgi:hypothetical protein